MGLSFVTEASNGDLDAFDLRLGEKVQRVKIQPYQGKSGISLTCTEVLSPNHTISIRQWFVQVTKVHATENLVVISMESNPLYSAEQRKIAGIENANPITRELEQQILEAACQWFQRRHPNYRCHTGRILKEFSEPVTA